MIYVGPTFSINVNTYKAMYDALQRHCAILAGESESVEVMDSIYNSPPHPSQICNYCGSVQPIPFDAMPAKCCDDCGSDNPIE